MLLPSIFEDNFVDDLFNSVFSTPKMYKNTTTSHMSADVKECNDKYLLSLELPGYEKSDISVELKDGYLTVTAKKSEKNEDKDKSGKYIRRECFTGQCQRSFYVGEDVTDKDIKASFKNGILELEVPKIEPKETIEEKKFIKID